MTKLIGLAGAIGAGKDTAAQVMRGEGWKQIAYADVLRDVLLAMNPIVGHWTGGTPIHLDWVIHHYGWQRYKESKFAPVIREYIQRLGTEGGRAYLGENVWVDATLSKINPDERWIVSDVRFPNEAEAIKVRGGKVFKIVRPGWTTLNSHSSETSLDGYPFDAVVYNDDSHDRLRQKLVSLVN